MKKIFILILLLFSKLSFSADEELYRLMVESHLGAGNLERALNVIEKAIKEFPDSYYWWKTYGDVLLWKGKPSEALTAYLRAYNILKNPELARHIFNLSVNLERPDIAVQFLDEVDSSPVQKAKIYETLGDYERMIEQLSMLKDRESMFKLADTLLTLGRKEETLRVIEEYEKLHGEDERILLLKADTFISLREFNKALDVLKRASHESKKTLTKKADLSWMLGKFDIFKESAEKLISMGWGREKDYERLSFIYEAENPRRAVHLSLEGWKKFKKLIFLERAMRVSFNNGNLKGVIKIAQENRHVLSKSTPLFILYINALEKAGFKEKAIGEIETFLNAKFDKAILKNYLHLLIETGDIKVLKRAVKRYEKYKRDPELALTFSRAYLVVGDSAKALGAYKHAKEKDELLYIGILNALGRTKEATYHRFMYFKRLENKIKGNKDLILPYLETGMPFLPADTFRLFLKKARADDKRKKNVYISRLMHEGKYQRVIYLMNRKGYEVEGWVSLELALKRRDTALIREGLKRRDISESQRILALDMIGEKGKAVNLAFENIKGNSFARSYIKDIYIRLGNRFSTGVLFYSRLRVSETRGNISARFKGLTLNGMFSKSSGNFPDGRAFNLSVEKAKNTGYLKLGAGWRRRVSDVFKLFGEIYKKGKGTDLGILAGRGIDATDTLYLEFYGYKNTLSISANIYITDRILSYTNLGVSEFFKEEGTYLGKGANFYGELSYKLNPISEDERLIMFTSVGIYEGNRSYLPTNFITAGLGYSISDFYNYTPSWKPILHIEGGYNFGIKGTYFGVKAGGGGPLIGGDRLNIQLDIYTNRVGVREEILRLNLAYTFWY